MPGADFYDYDDKYVTGRAELLIPAPIPHRSATSCASSPCRTFRALRCDGMARVDFFYEEDGRGLLVNEVNTIPGFTPHLDVPQAVGGQRPALRQAHRRAGGLALERHQRRSKFSAER